MKKKIIFFISFGYSYFDNHKGKIYGGAELNLYNLAQEFSKKKQFEVEFWTSDCGQNKIEKFDNITVKKIPFLYETNRTLFSKIFSRIFFIFYSLLSNADIFITSAASDFLFYLGIIKCIKKNIKIIFRSAHDNDSSDFFLKKNLLFNLSYRFALKKMNLIISQSSLQKKNFLKYFKLNSVILKNGHYLDYKTDNIERKYVSWIGRSAEVKRPELFLELAKKNTNLPFIMILSENNDLKNKIIEQSKDIPNLKVYDRKEKYFVLSLMSQSKCTVNTSSFEGFPNTFIESAMTGTPILSFKVDPDLIIQNNKIGFVCDDNLVKASKFINSLTPLKIDTYKKNCIDYCKKNHDIKKISYQYYRLIKSLFSK